MNPIDKAAEALLPWWGPQHAAMREAQARAVFASVDTDELAEVLIEAYTDWMDAGCPGSSTSFQAQAVKAHLLKEDS